MTSFLIYNENKKINAIMLINNSKINYVNGICTIQKGEKIERYRENNN